MRIAQLVNNFRKVTATTNNAIYSHTALLSNGLTARNNEVSLFASGDSVTNAKLNSVTPANTGDMDISERLRRNYVHLLISKCYNSAKEFDIIHSHLMLLSSFYAKLTNTPTVQSLHVPITDEIKPILHEFKDNYYVSFSLAQRSQMPELNWVANIYHGLDLNEFQFNPHPGDYFLYLGRIAPDKGLHLAIEAAEKAGVNLVIAGRSYQSDGYWHNEIEKHIDGQKVKYVGEANYQQKKELLQNAKALLFPTQAAETFGLSMIESMASGTPVIGWNNGSVAEIVQDQETGFVVNSVAEMVKAIGKIDKISRQACRERATRLFSIEKMVTGYEKVYLKVIELHKAKQAKK